MHVQVDDGIFSYTFETSNSVNYAATSVTNDRLPS